MATIDRSWSNATLQPDMYVEKLDISWLSLCITDVTASFKILDKYVLGGHRDQVNEGLLYRSVLYVRYSFSGISNRTAVDSGFLYYRRKWLPEGGTFSAAVGENDRPGMGSWARAMIHPSLESWDPQLSIDPTSVVYSTYYVPSFIWKPLRARICIGKIRACICAY
jgi:hypothetical protein